MMQERNKAGASFVLRGGPRLPTVMFMWGLR